MMDLKRPEIVCPHRGDRRLPWLWLPRPMKFPQKRRRKIRLIRIRPIVFN